MGGDVSGSGHAARGATIIVHFEAAASQVPRDAESIAGCARRHAERPGAGGGPAVVFAQARFFSLVFSGSACHPMLTVLAVSDGTALGTVRFVVFWSLEYTF
jgi:hypothetical protein